MNSVKLEAVGAIIALAAVMTFNGCSSMSPADEYFLNTETRANVFVSKLDADAPVAKVAILPFRAPTELIGSSVSDMFVTEMLRAGYYEMVERGQMSKVLGETELALAGLSSSKAIEAGKMMGADAVIIGTVDEYNMAPVRGNTYPVMGASIRMIDCQSGKVLWSVDFAERSTDKGMTLAEHGRAVVHQMTAALYKEWIKQGRPDRKK